MCLYVTFEPQCQNVSTDSGRTHYEVLGVHRLATQKEIKDAYLAMSKKVGNVGEEGWFQCAHVLH